MSRTKKTIIYVGGFELPDKNAAAQRVLANAKIFRDLGLNVVLIGVDKSLEQNAHIKSTKSKVSGFDSWAVPYPNTKVDWLNYITGNKRLEYLVEHYYKNDLYGVVCYNYPFVAQYKIKKMCTRERAIYIADATEWYESSGGAFLFRVVKWLDTTLRMRFLHHRADGVITTSKYLSEFYSSQGSITVELPTLYDLKPPRFNNLNLSEDKVDSEFIVKFMYAGSAFNIDRVNNKRTNIKDRLDKVILLFEKVYSHKTNFILNIYGLTAENYLSVFPEHYDVLQNLSNHIIFHGRKPHIKIIENIKESDFTIFLRDIDRVVEAGFPSKFSESISCGTPVLANKISNIEGYMSEGNNCYVLSLNDQVQQVKTIMGILGLSRVEIQKMKTYCISNNIFSYKSFTEPVKHFLDIISI